MDRATELALAARDGNRYALEEFVRLTHPRVQSLCRHLGDRDNADDLTQEVYYRALRALPRFRQDGSAISWLLRIARNTCADATRRRIRRRRRMTIEAVDEVETKSEPWTEVESLLTLLDDDRRSAFVLTQFVGLPYAEAAEVLGCPIGTVRSRVARAREQLLTLLAEADAGFG